MPTRQTPRGAYKTNPIQVPAKIYRQMRRTSLKTGIPLGKLVQFYVTHCKKQPRV